MTIKVFYNEIDPYCCAWLSNLMDAGHIRPGTISDKSIVDLTPDDVRGYEVAHFFAGIGGWDFALTLAGWQFDGRVVWTGSCPCQPFSVAGKQRGSDDERHLWPAFFRLIRECRPAIACGEQVAGAAGYAWWDHVAADLESEGYAAAACDLGAHSVGAPHRRQRLYWMAYANGWHAKEGGSERIQRGREHRLQPQGGRIGFVAVPDEGKRGPRRAAPGETEGAQSEPTGPGAADSMGDAQCARLEGHRPDQATFGRSGAAGPAATAGLLDPWSNVVWLQCSDGKLRPTGEVEPELQPVADRLSDSLGLVRAGEKWIISPLSCSSKNRVGRLRGYGNAIVPQVAAEFIAAYLDALRDATG
jgi:DNA (cytosine-5)-methyltransferase 1